MNREIREGTVKKGGQNPRPTSPRPPFVQEVHKGRRMEDVHLDVNVAGNEGGAWIYDPSGEDRLRMDICTCGPQEFEVPACTATTHRVFDGEDSIPTDRLSEGDLGRVEEDVRRMVAHIRGESLSTVALPTPKGSGVPIPEIVIRHIKQRSLAGTKKYGEPLKAHNGRDPMIDLYQELHDALVYIAQCLVEKYGEDFEI